MEKSIEVLKAMVLKAFKNYKYVYQTADSVTVEYVHRLQEERLAGCGKEYVGQRDGYTFSESGDMDGMTRVRMVFAYCDSFILKMESLGTQSGMSISFLINSAVGISAGVEVITSEKKDEPRIPPIPSKYSILTKDEKLKVLDGDFSGVVKWLEKELEPPKVVNLSAISRFADVEKRVNRMFKKSSSYIESFDFGSVVVSYQVAAGTKRRLGFNGASLNAFRELIAISDCVGFLAAQYDNGDGSFELSFGYDIDK
nr:MAG TPA: hypothetical protein [Caudoviricetes sp.]